MSLSLNNTVYVLKWRQDPIFSLSEWLLPLPLVLALQRMGASLCMCNGQGGGGGVAFYTLGRDLAHN